MILYLIRALSNAYVRSNEQIDQLNKGKEQWKFTKDVS
jgi:hypothetical protein